LGATTTIAIVAFFIIAIVIGFSTFAPLLGGLIDADGFFVDTQLQPKPEANEIICDLRVKVFANLDQTIALTEFFIRIDDQDSHNWTWFDCQAQNGFPALSLLDLGLDIPQNTLVLADTVETGCITIVDASDASQKVTPNTQPNLCRDVAVAEALTFISLPFNVDTEFVIQNIPLREYNLEIVYKNREIAFGKVGSAISLDTEEPFITKICDQFSVLEGRTCIRTG